MSHATASELKYLTDYAKYQPELGRHETWNEAVTRVMDMHRFKYRHIQNEKLDKLIDFVEEMYQKKRILGSQRALQFGGDPILINNGKLYNCLSSYADRNLFFQEAIWWLLCGSGIGFSVQKEHIVSLPPIKRITNPTMKTFVIPDSIEGWADAFGVLISSYTTAYAPFPSYQNKHVKFDYSLIRLKNSFITGGFKAPGPDPLRKSLEKCRELLERMVSCKSEVKWKAIQVYDFVMHEADAVVSGGVRRAATICEFSIDDEEMMNAKTGNWLTENPQRARSNNSAVIIRNTASFEQFDNLFESVKQFGEPGFLFSDDPDFVFNPCVEIGMYAKLDGQSGWQGCNLTEGNGAMVETEEDFYNACIALSILGTLQAGYTNFPYMRSNTTKKIFEREALLGCSFTGWTNSPDIMFDKTVQQTGAQLVISYNAIVADMIGINQSARTTCAKPAGNSSVLLGCASGVHGEHAPRFFRNMQMTKDSDVVQHFAKVNPHAVEECSWSRDKRDFVVCIPIEAKQGSLFKKDLIGVKQLELVKKTQLNWVAYGKNEELCVKRDLRHNVSNTIQVENWDETRDYIWENREHFTGVSLLGLSGDRDYKQAPFVEVFTPEQLLEMYGTASILASGLIVDGLNAFNNDLWNACNAVLGIGEPISQDGHEDLLKRDWIRRANKFSSRYLDGDINKTIYCVKDVYNLHKWEKLNREMVDIDWSEVELKPNYVDVSTLAASACSGGKCDI